MPENVIVWRRGTGQKIQAFAVAIVDLPANLVPDSRLNLPLIKKNRRWILEELFWRKPQ